MVQRQRFIGEVGVTAGYVFTLTGSVEGKPVCDYRILVQRLLVETGAGLVIINGLPPIHILPAVPQPLRWYLGQYARRLHSELRHWVATSRSFRFVSLQWAAVPEDMAEDRYHPGAGQYFSWAQRVADCIHLQTPQETSTDSLADSLVVGKDFLQG